MTSTRIYPGDGDTRHGSTNGYNNLRCRCALCRAAHAADFQKRRGSRAERLRTGSAPNVVHGSPHTYSNWRCRCTLCTVAWSKQKRTNPKGSE